jgi:hypothetical protein
MFRFSIRELVLLTLLIAMGFGWWLDRRALSLALAEYARELAYRGLILNNRYPQWDEPNSITRAMFNAAWDGKPLAP